MQALLFLSFLSALFARQSLTNELVAPLLSNAMQPSGSSNGSGSECGRPSLGQRLMRTVWNCWASVSPTSSSCSPPPSAAASPPFNSDLALSSSARLDSLLSLSPEHPMPASFSSSSSSSSSSSPLNSQRAKSWLPFFRQREPKKKVLILMSDTGGGHRASAQAIDQALQDQFPGRMDVQVLDIWTAHGRWPFNRCVPAYRFLAKHPLLWRGFYAYGAFPLTRKFTELWSSHSCYAAFDRAIRAAAPDLVVSVHPLCQYLPLSIIGRINHERLANHQPRIPFVTVVTDLADAHTTWFDSRADAYFVPTEAVRSLAMRHGIPHHKLLLLGLPTRPAFWKSSPPKAVLRTQLGLEDRKTALVMGGGDGVGGLAAITRVLAERLQRLDFPAQLVVICGHNQHMAKMLREQLQDGEASERCRVWIKGFVHNIDEFMAASDVVVTKAGPGTIAESMIRGLPMVLSSFLPGQESGNVPFVVNGGFGVYTGNRPYKIAETVASLFNDDRRLLEMSLRAKLQSHPEATMAIAKQIGDAVLKIDVVH